MNRRPRLRAGRRSATAVIVLLVAVNAVLMAVALHRRAPAGVDASGVRSAAAVGDQLDAAPASPSATPSTAPFTTASATPAPTATASPVEPKPLRLMVSAVSADVAWRATAGTCPTAAAVVEVSSDGGRTWRERDLKGAAVVRLSADSASKAFVVSVPKPGCHAAYQSTRGGDWSSPRSADSAWYRSPDAPEQVRAPGGRTTRPCGRSTAVVDLLSGGQTRAAALCADARVVRTTDAGRSWTLVGQVPGAVAIAGGSDASTLVAAVTDRPGCSGVVLARVSGSAGADLACVPVASTTPGQVAISVAGQALWLQAAGDTYLSTDAGATFTRRSE